MTEICLTTDKYHVIEIVYYTKASWDATWEAATVLKPYFAVHRYLEYPDHLVTWISTKSTFDCLSDSTVNRQTLHTLHQKSHLFKPGTACHRLQRTGSQNAFWGKSVMVTSQFHFWDTILMVTAQNSLLSLGPDGYNSNFTFEFRPWSWAAQQFPTIAEKSMTSKSA